MNKENARRRQLLRWAAIGLFYCSVAAFFAARESQASEMQNVVFIIADDQGWADYGFMEHPHVKTPNLDQLARESLLFTRGYVPSSLCRPSLASIITGRYPHEHGIVGNDPPVGSAGKIRSREEYLQHIDRAVTLPKILSERGYRSLQTGKWWEGNYQRGGFTHGMTHGDPSRGGRHGDEGLRIGRQGLEPIFDFVRQAQSDKKPFFIWYAPMMPHSPHDPPQRLLKKYVSQVDSIHVARYWAMIEWFDETCGELLRFLDEQQLSDNTLVIYVTDNGWINRADSGAFAPKSKRSPYDGGLRTPIMLRWPGHIEPARDDISLASSIDLMPTVLQALGIEPDLQLPGVDLLNERARSARRVMYGEIFDHDVQHLTDPVASLQYRWMIDDQWKLIVPHSRVSTTAGVELYDLGHDPLENHNLAESEPQRVKLLKDQLDVWWPTEITADQ